MISIVNNTTTNTFHINGKPIVVRLIRLAKNQKLVYYTEKGIKEILESQEKKISIPKNPSEEKKLIKSGHIGITALQDFDENSK